MKKVLLFFLFLFLSSTLVYAETYTTKKGLEMSLDEYNYLKNYFSDFKISNMSEETYSKYRNQQLVVVYRETKFFVSTYAKSDVMHRNIINSYVFDKEEYDEFENTRGQLCSYGDACYQTESKIIYSSIVCSFGNNNCGFDLMVNWINLPNTRSYDVVGFMWSGFTMTSFLGEQAPDINDLIDPVYYQPNGTNSKTSSNGLGISMNLFNNATGIQIYVEVDGTLSSYGDIDVYITYQHAKSSLTLADSKSYTFSSSGLGGVLYYSNATIRNKYDGMNGISIHRQYA